jgi:hypothetical protein
MNINFTHILLEGRQTHQEVNLTKAKKLVTQEVVEQVGHHWNMSDK